MDDPALVSAADRAGERTPERDRLLDRDRAPLEPLPERPAAHERHDEVTTPALHSRVEERHEAVSFAERAEEPSLALEAGGGVGRVGPPQDLDRDLAAVRGPAEEHDSRAAPADLGDGRVDPEARGPTARSVPERRDRRSGTERGARAPRELLDWSRAVLGALREPEGDRLREPLGERRVESVGGDRALAAEPGEELLDRLRPLEEAPPGDEPVEERGEGVGVRLGTDRLPVELLGGERVGSAEELARPRDARHPLRVEREPEVRELGRSRGVEEDVRGVHVAVDDAAPVEEPERLGEALDEEDGVRDRRPPPRVERLGERAPGDVLHHDEGEPRVRAGVEDSHDVRMRREPAEHGGLAGQALRPSRAEGREKLEGDERAARNVARRVDGPEGPATELALDAIPARDRAQGLEHREPP